MQQYFASQQLPRAGEERVQQQIQPGFGGKPHERLAARSLGLEYHRTQPQPPRQPPRQQPYWQHDNRQSGYQPRLDPIPESSRQESHSSRSKGHSHKKSAQREKRARVPSLSPERNLEDAVRPTLDRNQARYLVSSETATELPENQQNIHSAQQARRLLKGQIRTVRQGRLLQAVGKEHGVGHTRYLQGSQGL